MTTISQIEVECPICKTNFEISLLMSTNTWGSPDLDLRPPEMQRSTMNTWAYECPGCGYVASDFEDKPAVTGEFIESEFYQGCDGFEFKNPLSRIFYRQHLIEAHDLEKFHALLHAAWACDDSEDSENARLLREKCLDIIKNIDIDETLEIQKADILRRSRHFAQVIEEYERKTYSEDILNLIKDFQIEKSRLEDDGCYTVEDVLEK
ncbi:hypothetical protein [Methanobrevibacter sp.]|uniref:hypothetical protein n=1 Tax=Methanobrevibacter sp. TaxID=66852 RepID=UPI00388DF138